MGVLLVERLFKDQMNVTPQIPMAAQLVYAGLGNKPCCFDQALRSIYSSKWASMRRLPLAAASPKSREVDEVEVGEVVPLYCTHPRGETARV
jgi:hypothetical protein